MKETITDLFKFLINVVFSFWTFLLLLAGFILWMGTDTMKAEDAQREARRAATELCYTQGMVLVETDAGPRCADPRGLLKLK